MQVLDQAPNAPAGPRHDLGPARDRPGHDAGIRGARLLPRPARDRRVRDRRAAGRASTTGPLRRSSSPRSPGVSNFSRMYVFSLPAAALLACAVYAVLRAERLQRSGLGDRRRGSDRRDATGPDDDHRLRAGHPRRGGCWPSPAGPDVEPAQGAASTSACWHLQRSRWPRPWYLPNFDLISEYLTDFGYGERSAEYGASRLDHLLGSLDRRLRQARGEGPVPGARGARRRRPGLWS